MLSLRPWKILKNSGINDGIESKQDMDDLRNSYMAAKSKIAWYKSFIYEYDLLEKIRRFENFKATIDNDVVCLFSFVMYGIIYESNKNVEQKIDDDDRCENHIERFIHNVLSVNNCDHFMVTIDNLPINNSDLSAQVAGIRTHDCSSHIFTIR